MLHATDETVTEFAIESYAADAPLHVVALRTQDAKYATYSDWRRRRHRTAARAAQEHELYDYATDSGRLELHNSAGASPLEDGLRQTLSQAVRTGAARARCRRAWATRRRAASTTTSASRETPPTTPPPRANDVPNAISKGSPNRAACRRGETRVKELRRASRRRRR